MSKIKVLFIHHGSGWGGASISLINTINKIDKSKFEPSVLLLKDSIVKERLSENNIMYTVCKSYFYTKYYTYLTHSDAGYIQPYKIFKLYKIFTSWVLSKYLYAPKTLRKLKFDIVHLNSSVLSDWIYPASKQGKVIYHIREPISKGMFGIRYNFIRHEVQKYADKIIAISRDNAARINLANKTDVVYNFIDIPDEIPEESHQKSVLYVGGMAKIKGIDIFLEAIPFINEDIQLNLAGHYPKLRPFSFVKNIAYKFRYPAAYRLRTKLMIISARDNVKIIGKFSSIGPLLQESSLLISPFTKPHFSRPVIEAFAYGKPVIVSDVVGMDELVDHNKNGIIIENGNARSLADTINNLVNKPELLISMGAKGREKSISSYSPEINVLKIESIYMELVRERLE